MENRFQLGQLVNINGRHVNIHKITVIKDKWSPSGVVLYGIKVVEGNVAHVHEYPISHVNPIPTELPCDEELMFAWYAQWSCVILTSEEIDTLAELCVRRVEFGIEKGIPSFVVELYEEK